MTLSVRVRTKPSTLDGDQILTRLEDDLGRWSNISRRIERGDATDLLVQLAAKSKFAPIWADPSFDGQVNVRRTGNEWIWELSAKNNFSNPLSLGILGTLSILMFFFINLVLGAAGLLLLVVLVVRGGAANRQFEAAFRDAVSRMDG